MVQTKICTLNVKTVFEIAHKLLIYFSMSQVLQEAAGQQLAIWHFSFFIINSILHEFLHNWFQLFFFFFRDSFEFKTNTHLNKYQQVFRRFSTLLFGYTFSNTNPYYSTRCWIRSNKNLVAVHLGQWYLCLNYKTNKHIDWWNV